MNKNITFTADEYKNIKSDAVSLLECTCIPPFDKGKILDYPNEKFDLEPETVEIYKSIIRKLS